MAAEGGQLGSRGAYAEGRPPLGEGCVASPHLGATCGYGRIGTCALGSHRLPWVLQPGHREFGVVAKQDRGANSRPSGESGGALMTPVLMTPARECMALLADVLAWW